MDGDTFEAVLLAAFCQRLPGEPHDPSSNCVEDRSAAACGKGDPDFGRKLSGEFMEDERRQQADSGVGHSLGHFCQRVMLGYGRRCEAIKAAPRADKNAAPEQAKQVLAWDSARLDIPRTEDAELVGEPGDFSLCCPLQYDIIIPLKCAYCNEGERNKLPAGVRDGT